jgi:hypothetical protein
MPSWAARRDVVPTAIQGVHGDGAIVRSISNRMETGRSAEQPRADGNQRTAGGGAGGSIAAAGRYLSEWNDYRHCGPQPPRHTPNRAAYEACMRYYHGWSGSPS